MPTFELVSEVRNRDDTEHSGAVQILSYVIKEIKLTPTVFSPLCH